MLSQAVVVLAIAASAIAHPHAAKHRLGLKPSGSGNVVAPTGGVYGMGNSTGIYGPTGTGFATGTAIVPTGTASKAPLDTVVAPVPGLPSDVSACNAESQSTTTIYSTDLVTMTVYAEYTTTVQPSATVSETASDDDDDDDDDDLSDATAISTEIAETSAAAAATGTTADVVSMTAAQTSSSDLGVTSASSISSDLTTTIIASAEVTTESPAASSGESYTSSSMEPPNEMYKAPIAPAAPGTYPITAIDEAPEALEAPAPAPVLSPVQSTTTYGNGKRGLAYNSAKLTNAFADSSMSWAYNWAGNPDGTLGSGMEFVPMLWGEKMFSGWEVAAKSALAAGAKNMLSFNEPDLAAQANMDSATAAAAHIKYMNPYAGQVRIGSPAITNGGPSGGTDGMGLAWMKNFFAKCAGNCKVDFLAFHWYDSADNIAYFKNYVQDVIAMAKANGVNKVWLTEFAASGSNEQVAKFLAEVLPWMDSNDSIERYAYFMCSEGQLVNGGSISDPVGKAYAA